MHLFFDLTIYGFLAVDGLLVGLTIYRIVQHGRRWRPFVFLGVLVFFWLVIFYGSFIEPRRIVVTEQTITLRQAQDDAQSTETVRVVLISDLHLGPYKQEAWTKKVVEKIQRLSPDLVVIDGDFLLEEPSHPEYLAPLKDLHAKYGIYGVLGNHDYHEDELSQLINKPFDGNERVQGIVKTLMNAGVQMLKNQSVEIVLLSGKKFLLGGVDEYWTGRADTVKTFRGKNAALPKILVAHNPDVIWQAASQHVELMLAAHTHGGQIRLPFLGPVPNLPDALGRKYDRGLFRFDKTQLFITSGLGETGPRARLLVPPEIVLLNIEL